MIRRIIPFTLAAIALLALTAMAGEYGKTEAGKKAVEGKAEHVTMNGQLVCVGCDLSKGADARAACSAYGHRHALKTKDGRYVNFLENKFADDLIKGEKHHNKNMEVHGVYFAKANLLDVEGFSSEGGKKMSWCDHCKAMDACMASK